MEQMFVCVCVCLKVSRGVFCRKLCVEGCFVSCFEHWCLNVFPLNFKKYLYDLLVCVCVCVYNP